MTLANIVTFSRLFISPIFLFIYLKYEYLGLSFQNMPIVLLFLWLVLEFSDFADGYIARKYGQVTDLGKLLDPMADSISRITIFLTFTVGIVQLPMILVFIFLYRDFVVSTLRTVCALRGFTLAARWTGKVKAAMQASATACIIILLIFYVRGYIRIETLRQWTVFAVGMAFAFSVFFLLDYFYANRYYLKKLLKTK
jgi:CDP-diacylglycerol---glycerol-3-phosphate 3-phosphatidyltransferase